MNREKFLTKITAKWPVKVLSLAAAIVISVFYRMNTLETRSFSAPLYVLSNDRLLPVNSFINTVRINIRAEMQEILLIAEQDIEAYIDLGRFTEEGTYRAPVQIRKKGSSLGVEPLEITVFPAEIAVQLEEKISRNISVFPDEHGQTAPGFDLISRTFTPESVLAEGPRSSVNNHPGFTTGIIDLEGRNESFTVLVSIINDNPLITVHGERMIEYQAVIRRIEYQQIIPEISRSQETEAVLQEQTSETDNEDTDNEDGDIEQ